MKDEVPHAVADKLLFFLNPKVFHKKWSNLVPHVNKGGKKHAKHCALLIAPNVQWVTGLCQSPATSSSRPCVSLFLPHLDRSLLSTLSP